jgi:hypothetical protein
MCKLRHNVSLGVQTPGIDQCEKVCMYLIDPTSRLIRSWWIRRWAMMLPASMQVCPVELPGRGRREGETGINNVAELAALLAHSLPLQVC